MVMRPPFFDQVEVEEVLAYPVDAFCFVAVEHPISLGRRYASR
jgi:hypothetical protein